MLLCCCHLQDAATLYVLWPNGTCEKLGLSSEYNTSLSTMMEAMVNVSNPPAMAGIINNQLKQSMGGGNSTGSSAMGQVGERKCLWK